MKSNIYSRLFAIALVGFLVACAQPTPKEKLAELKKKHIELATEITALEKEVAKSEPDSAKKVKTKDVTIAEIAPRKFDHFVQTQGSVEAEDNIEVNAKSMGVITAVYVTEGQQVSKGQVLAKVDNAVLEQNVEGMKAQLELATTIYNRQKNLWDQKIGTEVQFLQAKTNKEALERQLASVREQSDMSKITSPISGTVDEVWAKVGQSLAGPAFRVVNTSNLKVKASVSEAYITNIKKGNKVLVNIPELNKELTAQVTFVGKTIDPLSRTFNVEIKVASNVELRPNMTATIKVIFHTEPSTLVVPVNVIQSLNNEKLVYIAEASGNRTLARKKVITIDGVFGNLAQVQGLKSGDKLITVGYQGLNDGDPIKL